MFKDFSELFTNLMILVLLLCVGFYFFGEKSKSNAAQQSPGEKVVRRDRFPADSPVVFFDEKSAGASTFFGKPMNREQSEWLKNYTFKIKNLTDKKISYLSLRFDFPETKKTGSEMSYRVSYGHATVMSGDHKEMVVGEGNSSLVLKPNENLEVSLEGEYEDLVRFLSTRDSISNLNTVLIRLGSVIFEDGTQWAPSSGYTKSDPANPGRRLKDAAPPLIPLSKVKESIEKSDNKQLDRKD